MRNLRFWLPTIIGALLTPVFLFAAAASTGAGHGSYAAALVLYPVSMMIMVSFAGVAHSDAFTSQSIQTISLVLVIGLAILQFPLYGFVLSYAGLKDKWWLTIAAGIICLHLLGVAVWLIIAGIMWAVGS
jgi:hypothetical protein